MNALTSGVLALSFATTSFVTSSSQADVYTVDRTFTRGIATASLVGTVEVPLGHYVVQNKAPNPFTAVELIMTVNSTSYHLTYPNTESIYGTGQFIVDATPTTLTFTASGNDINPADLAFYGIPFANTTRYVIGSNGNPAFEAAIFGEGQAHFAADVSFPVIFGTAIPEPSSLTLFALAMLGLDFVRRGIRRLNDRESAVAEYVRQPRA